MLPRLQAMETLRQVYIQVLAMTLTSPNRQARNEANRALRDLERQAGFERQKLNPEQRIKFLEAIGVKVERG
jgi:hypothetical protein